MINPLIRKINPNQSLAFAEVDYQNLPNLIQQVQTKGFDISALNAIKNKNRKFEWLCIRLLISSVVDDCPDIVYNKCGKPFLRKGETHISISHSIHKIAVLTNKNKSTGVDIQHLNEKIFRLKERFMRKEEIDQKKSFSIEELTLYWSAKEALFKVYGKNDIFLKEHILIENFNFDKKGGMLKGKLLLEDFPDTFTLGYEQVEDYILAYVVNP